MKKILKNKKGFTLVELLAVIVVLAIIMVIATQQVNKTIKTSRARSYADSVLSIKKSAKLACAESSLSDIDNYIDKSEDIKVTPNGNNIVVNTSGSNSKDDKGNDICIPNGKFANLDEAELLKQTSTGVKFENARKNNCYEVTIEDPCNK